MGETARCFSSGAIWNKGRTRKYRYCVPHVSKHALHEGICCATDVKRSFIMCEYAHAMGNSTGTFRNILMLSPQANTCRRIYMGLGRPGPCKQKMKTADSIGLMVVTSVWLTTRMKKTSVRTDWYSPTALRIRVI